MKPDKNPKPDRVKPEPDFEKSQKPDPSPTPTVKTRAGPEPDYLKPVTSLIACDLTKISFDRIPETEIIIYFFIVVKINCQFDEIFAI